MPPKKGSRKYKEAEREKKRQQREQETDKVRKQRLEQQKQYDTKVKSQMSHEEKAQLSEQKRLREASRRQKMTAEQADELKEERRLHEESHREVMSPEEKEKWKKEHRLKEVSRRRSMSPEKRKKLTEETRLHVASHRASMSPEKRAETKEQDKLRKAILSQKMSQEQKEELKQQHRLSIASSREKLSPAKKDLQKEKDRESHAIKRKHDKLKVITIQEAAENFHRKCSELPEYICTCCHRLLWKQSVLPFRIEKYDTSNDVITRCFADDILKETKPGEIYICTTCNNDLKKRKPIMPAQAVANGLQLDPTPPPGLEKPNQMEIMMFRREIPFMKMGSLPRGRQYRMQGPVVNVPSKLETVCQLLPRLPNEAMLVPIKLKRRLCYKGHYLYDDIRPHVVMDWLKWLKENNTHYADVNISFDWCNLMEQFQDDGNCIYPSLNTKIKNKLQILTKLNYYW